MKITKKHYQKKQRNRYHNMSEKKKQRLKEYQTIIVMLENIFDRYKKPITCVI